MQFPIRPFLAISIAVSAALSLWHLGVRSPARILPNGILPASSPQNPIAALPVGSFEDTILAAHNRYREEVEVPPLTWSATLAEGAQVWASQLAAQGGRLQHSSDQQRAGAGENLWAGTAGSYSYVDMVAGWGEEKQYFVAGKPFPNVSSTGNWSDVGHYTQMIWKDTTQVGCALATGGGRDVLVCRYSPSGNYIGESVY